MLTPSAISDDLTNFFRAGQISTAIAEAITVELTESAKLAHERLEGARFDQAPVVHEGRPVGWVATVGLIHARSIKSVMTSLENCTLVSAEASIATILGLLLKDRFLFTVSENGLSGFVVHSDMDRHAVRSYLYLLISGIEMLLAEIVKSTIPEERIVTAIHRNMKKAYQQAHSDNQETSPAEYLYIGDLVRLFSQTSYAHDQDLWSDSSKQLLLEIKAFRNSVMHPVRSIAAAENIETAANLPGWANAVSNQLRTIIESITVTR